MGATERGSRNAVRAAPRRARSRGLEVALARSGPDGASGKSGAGGPGGASGPDRPPRAGEPHSVQPPPPPPSAPPAARPGSIGRRPWQVAAASIALGLALAPLGPGTALVVGAPACGGLMVLRARAVAALALLLVVGGALAGEWRLAALDSRSERVDDGREIALAAHLVSRPRPSVLGSTAEIEVVDGSPLEGARLLLRLPRWVEAPKADIGAELGLEGRLRLLEHSEPGPASFDWAAHLRRHGVAGEYLADRVRLTGAGAAVWRACSIASARVPSVVSAADWAAARAPWREAWCSARTRRSTRACARTSGTPDWLTCWP